MEHWSSSAKVDFFVNGTQYMSSLPILDKHKEMSHVIADAGGGAETIA